ncbi:calmodulin-regulated spectrin-associated protein 2 isoform X3 [Octopus vulgaris]|uniref:Calmodulin-regulated spectrin-associated protein 2 isoform X3 n=1 Tax=Octopus vulgaris TaxID=6645 RepID=A0AA36ATM0_OCTVU|nr:calmodulin-regulated spectrin-associated protein 2 isoform X3 [Octopus vulgaris]
MEAGDTEGSTLEESDIIEIIPTEDYDIGKAKLRLSLSWILAKAYADCIPHDFLDLFYENAQGLCLLKPQLVLKLSSGEIYILACNNIFPEYTGSLNSFSSILQTLSRKGFYISDYEGQVITESVLLQTSPFKVKAHLSFLDVLMKAYVNTLVSIDHIVHSLCCFTNLDVSQHILSTVEDALLLWVNQVCLYVQQLLHKESQSHHDALSGQKFCDPTIPVLNGLSNIGDGCSLAVLISFYCSDSLRLQDIVIKKSPSIADCLFNLRLIKNFCDRYLSTPKCFHFTYEDLLYCNEFITLNVYVYLAELFNKFENPSSSSSTNLQTENKNGVSNERRYSQQSVANVPISNVTKKSFQTYDVSSISQDTSNSISAPLTREPLLSKRYSQKDVEEPHYTIPGRASKVRSHPSWQDQLDCSPALLAYSNADGVGNMAYNPKPDVDNWVASQGPSSDPLLPARLKPAKEKNFNHSKEAERGDQHNIKMSSPCRGGSHGKQTSRILEEPMILDPTDQYGGDISREESSLQQLFKRSSMPTEQSATFPRSRHSSGASNPDDSLRQFGVDQSFTLPDRPSSVNSARQEGLPVVPLTQTDEIELRRCFSREGSIASNRSSGDFSDHESQKIHRDHKAKESKDPKDTFILTDSMKLKDPLMKPLFNSGPIMEEILDKSKTTNFAQIKKMRDMSGPLTSLVYMQRGQEPDSPSKVPLKDPFQKKDEEKSNKAHQITWQQNSRRSHVTTPESPSEGQHSQSDQVNIRMKLEERRKQIEQKKFDLERQQTKIRHQVGKEAFLHMVASQSSAGIDKNGQVSGGIPANIRRYMRQNSSGENITGEDSSHFVSQRPSHKPFSREEIQRTIENARKKWLNESAGTKTNANDSYESEVNEQSVRQASSSPLHEPFRREPVRHEAVPIRQEPVRHEAVPIRQEPMRHEAVPMRQEPVRHEAVPIRQEPVRHEAVPIRQEPVRHEAVPLRHEALPIRHEALPIRHEALPIRQEAHQRDAVHHESFPVRPDTVHHDPISLRQDSIAHEAAVVRPQPVVAVQPGIRDSSSNRASPDRRQDPTNSAEREENYGNYNNSLDRLNRSLTDLQGEIMKLSLQQQQQLKSQTLDKSHPKPHGALPNASTAGIVPTQHGELHLQCQIPFSAAPGGHMAGSSEQPPSYIALGQYPPHMDTTGHFNPSCVVQQPGYATPPLIPPVYHTPTSYQPHFPQASPYQPTYPGQQFMLHSPTPPTQPYMSPVMSPYPTPPPHSVGIAHHLPNTYTTSVGQPIPTATPYSGLPGHPKPELAGVHPSMANAVITSAAGGAFSLHGNQTRTQEEPLPSGYAPHPHAASSSGYVPYLNSSNNINTSSNITNNVNTNNTVTSSGVTSWHSPSGSPSRQSLKSNQSSHHGSPSSSISSSPPHRPSKQPPPPTTSSADVPSQSEEAPTATAETDTSEEPTSSANEGFFVSFGNEQPRRPKPKLTKREKKEEKKDEKLPVPPVSKETAEAATPPKLPSPSKPLPPPTAPPPVVEEEDVPAAPAVAFVLEEPEECLDEDEMAVRRKRMLKQQQKRREEQELRRQQKEEAFAKKRAQEMLKKEEIAQRKEQEKARRQMILQQYKERKRKEEDDEKNPPTDRYERPARNPKPRPKSMIVRSSKPPEVGEDDASSIHSTSSQEDIAGRGFSSPTSSNSNSKSGPLLSTSWPAGPSQLEVIKMGLQHGICCCKGISLSSPAPARVSMNLLANQGNSGRTNFGRRPPSPDLYRFGRKSGKSTESSSDAGSTAGSDYTGPKLFVKPSSKSNRHIIINAISHCCLAGCVNLDLKNKVLEEIAKSDAKHFVILFRDTGCAFRSLYAYYPEREEAVKIHGIGPKLVTSKNIEKYYKYNSGGKSFAEVTSTKHLSVSIDAIVINGSLWKSSRMPTGRR